MHDKEIYDITEVCSLFHISSRTLRFYEEKGLIQSSRSDDSNRRKYTEAQVEQIRNVIILRTIGLPIRSIQEYIVGKTLLTDVINLRRAEISALIKAKAEEIRMLNEVLAAVEDGEDIFDRDRAQPSRNQTSVMQLSIQCAEYILQDDLSKLYPHFSRKMKDYMPMDSFRKMWVDSIVGLGAFVRMGQTKADEEYDHIVYQYIIFEKMTVRIKFVYRDEIIHGLWIQYCEGDGR